MRKILIGLLLCLFFATLSFAGDIYPEYGAMTTVNSGTTINGKGDTDLGTIDCSGHYECLLFINFYAENGTASNDTGVSVYFTESASGVTDGQSPRIVVPMSDDTYENLENGASGVTVPVPVSNVPFITLGASAQNAADNWFVRVYRILMKGKYN